MSTKRKKSVDRCWSNSRRIWYLSSVSLMNALSKNRCVKHVLLTSNKASRLSTRQSRNSIRGMGPRSSNLSMASKRRDRMDRKSICIEVRESYNRLTRHCLLIKTVFYHGQKKNESKKRVRNSAKMTFFKWSFGGSELNWTKYSCHFYIPSIPVSYTHLTLPTKA